MTPRLSVNFFMEHFGTINFCLHIGVSDLTEFDLKVSNNSFVELTDFDFVVQTNVLVRFS